MDEYETRNSKMMAKEAKILLLNVNDYSHRINFKRHLVLRFFIVLFNYIQFKENVDRSIDNVMTGTQPVSGTADGSELPECIYV